jgi:hypothetical protein
LKVVSKKIRNSARDEACTFQIPTVCNFNQETTVLCHLPDDHGGTGAKSSDLSAAYGCSSCHDAVDRRVDAQGFESNRDWYLRRAQNRTLSRLLDKGILVIL